VTDGADAQVGFEMTTAAPTAEVDMSVPMTVYVGEVGDLTVLAMGMGGQRNSPGGQSFQTDAEMVDAAYEGQIDKVSNAG
jgi:hypothetical protein